MLLTGQSMPNIEFIDHNGDQWRIADAKGTPLLLILHRHLA